MKEKLTYKDYLLKSNVLYKIVDDCELLVVPKGNQNEIIRKAHERGHFSTKQTKDLIFNGYLTPKLDEKINRCIANCIPCVIANRKRVNRKENFTPYRKKTYPFILTM